MSVEIIQQGARHCEVHTERLGLVGRIYDFSAGPFQFRYIGNAWMKLTYDENTAVQAAVLPKITLLNITKRLTE